jgi:hypothetical protein
MARGALFRLSAPEPGYPTKPTSRFQGGIAISMTTTQFLGIAIPNETPTLTGSGVSFGPAGMFARCRLPYHRETQKGR